jgi:hypothetical protein
MASKAIVAAPLNSLPVLSLGPLNGPRTPSLKLPSALATGFADRCDDGADPQPTRARGRAAMAAMMMTRDKAFFGRLVLIGYLLYWWS